MTREERIVAAVKARLAAIPGVVAVDVNPSDDHGDDVAVPRFAILTAGYKTEPVGEFNRHHGKVRMPLTVRGLADGAVPDATEGVPDPNESTAGFRLFASAMQKLFPTGAATAYQDDLGEACSEFLYDGHEIVPREDGGQLTAVYIDCNADYVLHLDNPDK